MSIAEIIDRVRHAVFPGADVPQDRSTRQAAHMDELSDEWVIALAKADHSHLPSRDDPPPMR